MNLGLGSTKSMAKGLVDIFALTQLLNITYMRHFYQTVSLLYIAFYFFMISNLINYYFFTKREKKSKIFIDFEDKVNLTGNITKKNQKLLLSFIPMTLINRLLQALFQS